MKNQHRPLNIDLLFRVPTVASYHLARDGRTLAFAWNKTGQHEIYLLNTQRANPERVTFPPESKFVPRFSPTGQELAYTMDHQGDEQTTSTSPTSRHGRVKKLHPTRP